MLNNKKFNIVLSLLIAIGIWAYVIGETNPTATKVYRDIPIQLVNQQVLEANGLAISDVSAEMINVTLTGTRANINKTDFSDITASVDLADVAMGENQLRVTIRVPDSLDIEDKSLNKITITVDKRVSKEFKITPEYEGTFPTEAEPITVELSRDSVTVTGAASLVEKVNHVCAKVSEGEVSEELRTIGCTLIPVDNKGTEVNRLELSSKSVQITAVLATVKTVALKVPVVDYSDGLDEKKISAPKTITIKGKSSTLDSIESVICEPVDITEIEEDTVLTVKPVLPEGVQISSRSSESLRVKVTVIKINTKTFEFETDEIQLKGQDENLNAELKKDGKIEVSVSGKAEQLDAIEKDDITLSVDLTGLEKGTHQVVLAISCGKEYTTAMVNPEEIRVVIE